MWAAAGQTRSFMTLSASQEHERQLNPTVTREMMVLIGTAFLFVSLLTPLLAVEAGNSPDESNAVTASQAEAALPLLCPNLGSSADGDDGEESSLTPDGRPLPPPASVLYSEVSYAPLLEAASSITPDGVPLPFPSNDADVEIENPTSFALLPLEGEPVAMLTPNAPLMPGDIDVPPPLPSEEVAQQERSEQASPGAVSPESLQAGAIAGSLVGPMAEPSLQNALGGPLGIAGASEVSAENSGKTWRVSPRFSTGYLYDDNIFISHTSPTGSGIYKVGGGLHLQAGGFHTRTQNYLIADYSGLGAFYADAPQQNAYDQKALLMGQYSFNKLHLQLQNRLESVNGPNRDSGNFARTTQLYNSIAALYDYSAKTSLKAEAVYRGALFPGLQNSEYYELHGSMNYQWRPKLNVGLLAIGGYNTIQNSPSQMYQIVKGELRYTLDQKLLIKADGGIECNEYTSGGQSLFTTPVFKTVAEYIPFGSKGSEGKQRNYTQINLVGYRGLYNSSSLASQNYVATGTALEFSRYFHQWVPQASVGYENDTYYASLPTINANRVDNFCYLRPGIGYEMKYLRALLYYQFRTNTSNSDQYSWRDNQIGIDFQTTF